MFFTASWVPSKVLGALCGFSMLWGFFLDAKMIPLDPPLIRIGGGIFDVNKEGRRKAQASLEYQWSPFVYKLRPMMGGFGTDQETLYFYFGLAFDIFFGKHVVLTPSFAPGLYFKGHGKNLGYLCEFRSAGEIAVVFAGQHRLGIQFYHISNASLGYKNPGANGLVLMLSIPLNY